MVTLGIAILYMGISLPGMTGHGVGALGAAEWPWGRQKRDPAGWGALGRAACPFPWPRLYAWASFDTGQKCGQGLGMAWAGLGLGLGMVSGELGLPRVGFAKEGNPCPGDLA